MIAARVQPLTRTIQGDGANAMQALPVALVALAIVFSFRADRRWPETMNGWAAMHWPVGAGLTIWVKRIVSSTG